jgi:asparagine synthase (glutamine-hydrolysing)
MCGIVGVLNLNDLPPVDPRVLRGMLAMIRHRGPDGFGIYRDAHIGMGNARLSIIDLSGGDQPIGNEDGTLWIVYNGEVFNYVELRPQLEAAGHRFTTQTDTEVILHLYEDYGPECLRFLNGQFALAIWDQKNRSLFLARDRAGIRPLFYSYHAGQLLFASEVKSLLSVPGMRAEVDRGALREVFTNWSVQPPRTIFTGISELPPAHYLYYQEGQIEIAPYWGLDYSEDEPQRSEGEYLDELESLLIDATRIRLRADVPVGAYLSGGLDSSVTTALIRAYTGSRLDTFSIAFANENYNESPYQQRMAEFLGTQHHEVYTTHADIGAAFPDVIWHTETPILRTAPAPLFLLSRLVHENNFKVVMTGEGADEILAGYDIFKEMKIRRFWARDPESNLRPLLLQRLYPDIKGLNSASGAYLKAFFKKNLTDVYSPWYSHAIRWSNTARTWRFFADPPAPNQPLEPESLHLPRYFGSWSPLAQAQYLEFHTFLSPYLLSSQGDRMAMAHSVEGRYPFLDYRVIEFCNRLPSHLKLEVLTEKYLLKQLGRKYVPESIWQRVKRPYRAPIQRSFFPGQPLDWVQELTSEAALRASGYFQPEAVSRLLTKSAAGGALSEVDDMALVGILSTQLLHHQFVDHFSTQVDHLPPTLRVVDKVGIVP